TALAAGLWLSALNVQYRDVRHTLTFIVQFWLFASPVVYPSTLIPARWRPLYGLNPMAGVIEGFRWALLRKAPAPGPMLGVSILVTAAILVGGLYYFRRMEKTFADVVSPMSTLAISCDGLAKQYRIGEREKYKALREAVTQAVISPFRR